MTAPTKTRSSFRSAPARRRLALGALLAVVAIVGAGLGGVVNAQPGTPVALVSRMGGHPGPLDRGDVRAIFSGRRTEWARGERIQLVLPPKGSPEMRWLCKELLGLPEEVYRRYLLQKVFRGELRQPIFAQSSAEVIELVRTSPGAIGPASAAALPAGVPTVILR